MLLLLLVICCCTAAAKSANLNVNWNGRSFSLAYQSERSETLLGELGAGSIPAELNPPEACGSGNDSCWAFGALASIQLTPSSLDDQCYSVSWTTSLLHSIKVKNSSQFLRDLLKLSFEVSLKGLFPIGHQPLVRRRRSAGAVMAD